MRLAWIVDLEDDDLRAAVNRLRSRLAETGLDDTDVHDADVVVVWADRPLPRDLAHALADPGLRVVLAGPTLAAADADRLLAETSGVHTDGATAVHDVRVRVGRDGGGLPTSGHAHAEGDHVGVHDHVTDRITLVDKVADDVEVLRTAYVGLAEHPVMTWRPGTATGVWTLGTLPGSVHDRTAARELLTMLRHVAGAPGPRHVRVGLLGYGAIGHEHSRAVRAVEGLDLTAVCDTSAARLDAAAAVAPEIATMADGAELLARDDVDLVVVSTPPSTHATWALRAIRAGKHVLVEKPFAIRTDEADAVLAEAAAAERLAVVYQNRRFDPDHLAVRRAVQGGALGEVFHVETFVGGYGHPCNLWHSDEGVSGGAFYDWGAHVLDQILDLVPTDIDHVTAAAHKRRWYDVTNADHSRVTIRFADGAEAEFVHSDLAAALKPRWYVLGTAGALVGHWRTEKVVSRNDIGTLEEDVLAPADSPPLLDLHGADGSVTRLATPPSQPYAFHHELADRLRLGLPMTVTGQQSRRVLSVMEAARCSAEDSGRPVVPQ
ncbi:MAG: Gfo/Idh/MocA family oxidoreductase [Actinomycetales bacterium]|nr:Gfo/Idh/MocA family oxidoreductase [Actinomycetales bacterium]